MEFDKEITKNEKNTNLESRITAGPITDIIARTLVQREGFIVIYNHIVKVDTNKYKKNFYFSLDDGDYYDEISEIIEDDDLCLDSIKLNGGLKDDELYIAYFRPIWPPYKISGSSKEIAKWMYGSGDLYSDKDITVDETGRVREISLSGV